MYFKEIARSTISTYLNMLKKEFILYKERDGRIVYYIFYEDPPIGITPFWFTRIFCIVPAYFDRAKYFANLYMDSKEYVQHHINEYNSRNKDILIRNFKFITGLIILNILKNRSSKCILCQFSKREIYNKLEEIINIAVKDRSDVLPEELNEDLVDKFAEIMKNIGKAYNNMGINIISMDEPILGLLVGRKILFHSEEFMIETINKTISEIKDLSSVHVCGQLNPKLRDILLATEVNILDHEFQTNEYNYDIYKKNFIKN